MAQKSKSDARQFAEFRRAIRKLIEDRDVSEDSKELLLKELEETYRSPDKQAAFIRTLGEVAGSASPSGTHIKELIDDILNSDTKSSSKTRRRRNTVKPFTLSDRSANRSDDLLGYDIYARALIDFLTYPESIPPYAVAITGGWGTGKTTLLRWLRDELKAKGYRTSWFSAWRHNRKEAVWAALARQLIEDSIGWRLRIKLYWLRLCDYYSIKLAIAGLLASLVFWDLPYVLQLSGVAVAINDHAIAIAGKVVALAGLYPVIWPALKAIRNPLKAAIKVSGGPDYQAVLGFQGAFELDFRRLINICGKPAKPLFIFIDDLDRAPLPTSVEVIEAMNILLGDGNCVFIVGLDMDIVAASIEAKYQPVMDRLSKNPNRETNFTGHDFLEKMFQLVFNIPLLSSQQFEMFARGILGDKEEVRSRINKVHLYPNEFQFPIVNDGDQDYENAYREAQQTYYINEFTDSSEVKAAVLSVCRFIPRNPRKLKRFLNTFRLLAFLANRRSLADNTKLRLDHLALVTLLALEYPSYFKLFKSWKSEGGFRTLSIMSGKERSSSRAVQQELLERLSLTREDFKPELKELYEAVGEIKNKTIYLSLSSIIEDSGSKT